MILHVLLYVFAETYLPPRERAHFVVFLPFQLYLCRVRVCCCRVDVVRFDALLAGAKKGCGLRRPPSLVD